MSNEISLQVDLGSLPLSAVGLLRNILPIIQSLAADNVSPLAVVQAEAIGRCFQMSGVLANRTRDALIRSGSATFSRLQASIGFKPESATVALAQTAGGQTIALLSLCLVEMFCRNSTGHLLFDLSMKVLPKEQCLASMSELSDLAEVISNKLQPLAFGQHHATQITRIRQAYFHAGIQVPPSTIDSLLDRLTVESMVDLLDYVQQALRDDTIVVYIKGFKGLGGIVSLLMALCPDDVLLLVENGIIFQGLRRSVVISVTHHEVASITAEKIFRGSKLLAFRDNDFLAQPGRISPYEQSTMRVEGCLAEMVQQLFDNTTLQTAEYVVPALANLVAAIMCSFEGSDFGPLDQFPRGGLRSLLGLSAREVIRDKIGLLFAIRPSLDIPDPVLAYETLRQSVARLVPDSACLCSQCPGSHSWATTICSGSYHCPLLSIWGGLQTLVGYAVLLSLVDTKLDALRIVQNPQTKMGQHLCRRLMHRVLHHAGGIPTPLESACDDSKMWYTVRDLHQDMCQLFGSVTSNAGGEYHVLGTSNGATSIVPSTLDTMSFDEGHAVRYRVLDGQFHDRHTYYKTLIEDARVPPRPLATRSLPYPTGVSALGSSCIGAHSDVTLSLRPHHNSLAVRTVMTCPEVVVSLSFYDTHLAYMAVSTSTISTGPPYTTCSHDQHDQALPLDEANPTVVATGLDSPVASKYQLSMVLTHANAEAQFLAGVLGVPSLYQGTSCLNCAVRDARAGGFKLLIQS